jgi:hypothetical protein
MEFIELILIAILQMKINPLMSALQKIMYAFNIIEWVNYFLFTYIKLPEIATITIALIIGILFLAGILVIPKILVMFIKCQFSRL